MRIKKLPTQVANQIAAGEVIERPASVVKELLENAQDAFAKNINIELGFGGLNQIKISDDGHGILEADMPLAILAHATSKISNLDDLYSISSMGFRGEALASIASVAKLTITSKPDSQKHAYALQVTADEVVIKPSARSIGTTIAVDDLFYNAPVRKKFLKGQRTELQHVEDVIKRFALAAPSIAINVKHNLKLILNLPAATCERTNLQRIKKIFGANFVNSAIPLSAEHAGMSLKGYLGGLDYQRSQRDKLWIYLNNRMVKDKLLLHAIMQVYQDYLTPGRYPACLLYLQMPPADVDVNVHPTKHEVRFKSPRDVHDFILAALSGHLDTSNQKKPADTVIQSPVLGNYTPQRLEVVSSSNNGSVKANAVHSKWYTLNSEFVVIYSNQQAYLLNAASLYTDYCRSLLTSQDLPIPSRPLLVPINCTFENEKQISAHMGLFLEFGIGVDFIGAQNIAIRTVPTCLPLLDIKSLFNKVSLKKDMSKVEFVKLLLASQAFDAQQVCADEQTTLIDYMDKQQLFAKYTCKLDSARCKGMFADV